MPGPAAHFETISVSDYAAFAFGISGGKPDPAFEGGIFAGKGTAWQRGPAKGDGAPPQVDVEHAFDSTCERMFVSRSADAHDRLGAW